MTCGSAAALLVSSTLLALTAPARLQGACSYAHSGYLTGLPYRLPVTYLTPGVANWMVAIPLPVECAGGQAAGQEALACDHDARPSVRAMHGGLQVRRAGWLRGYATVQVTVYCVFPYPPRPPLLNMLPAPPNMLPAWPNTLPALPNRSQNVTELALLPTAPTPQRSNDKVTSISTTTIPELSSSSDEEKDKEESEGNIENNRRILQWRPARFLQ